MDQQTTGASHSSLFQLNLEGASSYILRSAATWAKVTGIAGIGVGVIFLLLLIITLSRVGESPYRRASFDELMGFSRVGVGMLLLVITAIVFIVGGIFSVSFGNRMSLALRANDQQKLNAGIASLRNYYALRGIVMVVVLLLLLLSLLGNL